MMIYRLKYQWRTASSCSLISREHWSVLLFNFSKNPIRQAYYFVFLLHWWYFSNLFQISVWFCMTFFFFTHQQNLEIMFLFCYYRKGCENEWKLFSFLEQMNLFISFLKCSFVLNHLTWLVFWSLNRVGTHSAFKWFCFRTLDLLHKLFGGHFWLFPGLWFSHSLSCWGECWSEAAPTHSLIDIQTPQCLNG